MNTRRPGPKKAEPRRAVKPEPQRRGRGLAVWLVLFLVMLLGLVSIASFAVTAFLPKADAPVAELESSEGKRKTGNPEVERHRVRLAEALGRRKQTTEAIEDPILRARPPRAGAAKEDAFPLYVLARDCEKGNPEERAQALERIATRNDIWAYDLLNRFGTDAFAESHRVTAATALLAGHTGGTTETGQRFSRLWAKATDEERLEILQRASGLYGEQHSGLQWYRFPESSRRWLRNACQDIGEALRPDMRDLAERLVGPIDPPTKANVADVLRQLHEVAQQPERVARATNVFEATRRLAAGNEAFAKEADNAMAVFFKNWRRAGEGGNWDRVLRPEILKEPCKTVRALAGIRGKNDLACRDAYESALWAALVANAGSLSREAIEKAAQDRNMEPLLRAQLLSAWCVEGVRLTTAGYRRGGVPPEVPYAKYPPPFCYYLAEICAREGDAEAQKFLTDSIGRLIKRAADVQVQLDAAYEAMDRVAVAAARREMEPILNEVTDFVRFTHPDRSRFDSLLKTMDEKAAGLFEGQSAMLLVRRQEVDAEREGTDLRGPRPAEEIRRIKDQYQQKKLGIRQYLDRMDELNALDDPDLYKAFKANPENQETLDYSPLLCKMLGYSGQPDDCGILYGMWTHGHLEVRKALVAAAEKRAMRTVMEPIVRLHSHDEEPELRILAAHMVSRLGRAKDLDFILEQLKVQKDERCLEFLAIGLLDILQTPSERKACAERLATVLKQDEYGPRWFYVASALRAAAPTARLDLDPSATGPGRDQKVDAAIERVSSDDGR